MTYEEVFEYVGAEPFRPFEIQMASERAFEIRHPENIRVGEHSVHVFIDSDRNQRVYERPVTLGYIMMESLECVDDPVAQQ
jgi:hypothetical protein